MKKKILLHNLHCHILLGYGIIIFFIKIAPCLFISTDISIPMATKNCSEMDSSYPKWSKVMLNDSKELRKKQSRDCGRKYNRRLFSQMKSTPIPNRLRSKPAFYQRYMAKPRRGTPSNQKTAPKQPKPNTGSEWKKEYDVWNMIVQALDQSLLTNHKVNWPNKVIGIRDSNDNIQLIHNREELQQQALVASNGLRTHFNDLLNANDSNDDFSLKMKFKLVPVLETLTLVNESTETPYTFAGDINDLNNNNNVMQCEHFEVNKVDGEKEDSKEDDTLNNVNNHESTQNITCEKTLTNDSCSTWETCSDVDSYDYSLFCNDITPASSSTFISDGNDMEITPAVVHEIENISLLMAPNGYVSNCICFIERSFSRFVLFLL